MSLGWCFWHRACYGCLLCGSRQICQGLPQEELFRCSAEIERNGVKEAGRDRGREIDVVPLCANCLVDAEVDELDEDAVLQKGLRRMDHTDGGMGRMRWEAQKLARLRSSKSPEVCLLSVLTAI